MRVPPPKEMILRAVVANIAKTDEPACVKLMSTGTVRTASCVPRDQFDKMAGYEMDGQPTGGRPGLINLRTQVHHFWRCWR